MKQFVSPMCLCDLAPVLELCFFHCHKLQCTTRKEVFLSLFSYNKAIYYPNVLEIESVSRPVQLPTTDKEQLPEQAAGERERL